LVGLDGNAPSFLPCQGNVLLLYYRPEAGNAFALLQVKFV
jgi:hypothetical protein